MFSFIDDLEDDRFDNEITFWASSHICIEQQCVIHLLYLWVNSYIYVLQHNKDEA